MNAALKQYIDTAREKGYEDERIKRNLVEAGWDEKMVEDGLKNDDGLEVPPPPPQGQHRTDDHPEHPQSVVQSMSTRGMEYIIMFIAMGAAAFSLGSLLHSNVNTLMGTSDGTFTRTTVSFASAALVVALPVFGLLFFRLKKAENHDSGLHHDPSRKRAVQLTLIITFLIGLSNIIFFVYNLMTGGGNNTSYNAVGSPAAENPVGNVIHLLITLAIAGGIFGYYWQDEHKNEN